MLSRIRLLGTAAVGVLATLGVIGNNTEDVFKRTEDVDVYEQPVADIGVTLTASNLQSCRQIIHGGYVVDFRSDVEQEYSKALVDHSIAIGEDGRIVAVLPRAQMSTLFAGQLSDVDCGDCILIPGLVNAHAHCAMTLFRGWVEGVSLMTWLHEYIWPAEREHVDERFVEVGTKLALAEMIRCGVTTVNDMYFFPHVTAAVAREAGIRAFVGLPVLSFPSCWATSEDDYFDKALDILAREPNNVDDALVRYTWAPHAPYTCSNDALRRVAELAELYDMRVHTHLHESADNVADSLRQYGMRPVERLRALGMLNERLVAAHLTQLVPSDIGALHECGAHVVHCPESNLKLASGICALGSLHRAGVNVALGTDGAASNDDLDVLGELRTAALLDKYVSGADAYESDRSPPLSAAAMLRIATLGGARALAIDSRVGRLVEGFDADIVAVRLRTEPIYDPIVALVQSGHPNQVQHVFVRGQQLLDNGELTSDALHVDKRELQFWKETLNEE
jgi:5-methylthioadenosine/S-adenosylhomocysteine deaminase